MNWLRRKINNWLNDDDEDYNQGAHLAHIHPYEESGLYASGMSFKLFSANGGIVVKVTSEGRNMLKEDDSSLHIIPKDQDLAESLAKIITLEVLRGK